MINYAIYRNKIQRAALGLIKTRKVIYMNIRVTSKSANLLDIQDKNSIKQ